MEIKKFYTTVGCQFFVTKLWANIERIVKQVTTDFPLQNMRDRMCLFYLCIRTMSKITIKRGLVAGIGPLIPEITIFDKFWILHLGNSKARGLRYRSDYIEIRSAIMSIPYRRQVCCRRARTIFWNEKLSRVSNRLLWHHYYWYQLSVTVNRFNTANIMRIHK